MAVTIQIEDRTAAVLKAQAEACGLSLEDYLRRLASSAPAPLALQSVSATDLVAEFDAALDELFASDLRKLPATVLTYSREDIYSHHD